jgi:hypothetical protein
MREIRQSGSEGGGGETNRLSLPLFKLFSSFLVRLCAKPFFASLRILASLRET